MTMKEIWKSVEGWEGFYEVSSCGRVRSLDRIVKWGKHRKTFYKGRILKTDRKLAKGYPTIVFVAGKKERQTITVHRLMAKTFLRNPHNFPIVRHLNDIPKDNRLENLAWGTLADNYADRRCPHCRKRLK